MNAFFQDVGKIKISPEILNKMGILNDAEYKEIQNHPKYGLELVREVNNINLKMGLKQSPLTYLVGCLHHHNNWDGSGYPSFINKGELMKYSEQNIPLIGRICTLVDKFAALTSPRPYREKIHTALAIKYLKEDTGVRLDPVLVQRFIDVICPFKTGSTVKLSNGDLGVVKAVNKEEKFNPVILPYIRKLGHNKIVKITDQPARKILDADYDIVINDKFYKGEIYNSISACYA
jgi:HD-GYP domain-containing protein (c-di-GMP phosphodiesterase class II)